MARPFRHLPPSPAGELIRRARLVTRLDGRWDHRLVTVVAGPGFGKTCLLVDAMVTNAAQVALPIAPVPSRRDVWLGCEPGDDSAASLLRGLRVSCGLRPQGTLAALCAWVWSQAPDEVCFVLDDVHEIGLASEGMALIRQLLVELPLNGHLVIASREPVALPAARLAASRQLLRITEVDLLFDGAELRSFAGSRGISAELCASSAGWPALAELLASAGEDLVFDYLWDEVLARAGPRRAECIALFHAVGGGDDGIAFAVSDGELSARQLVAGLPLVARSEHQGAVLHPLWGPPLRDAASAATLDGARLRAAAVHRRAGRYAQAIELQLDAEAWDVALATMRLVALDHAFVGAPDEFGRWYRALPAGLRGAPRPSWPQGSTSAATIRSARRRRWSQPPPVSQPRAMRTARSLRSPRRAPSAGGPTTSRGSSVCSAESASSPRRAVRRRRR